MFSPPLTRRRARLENRQPLILITPKTNAGTRKRKPLKKDRDPSGIKRTRPTSIDSNKKKCVDKDATPSGSKEVPKKKSPNASAKSGDGGKWTSISDGALEVPEDQSAQLVARPSSEFQPADDPAALKQVLESELGCWAAASWDEQFQTIENLRCLCLFHRDHVSPIAHESLSTAIEGAMNLRSALAKNGVLCLGDIMVALGRSIGEDGIDKIVTSLLSIMGKESKFLIAAADDTMSAVVQHAHPHLLLMACVRHLSVKGTTIASRASVTISQCLQRLAESREEEADGEDGVSMFQRGDDRLGALVTGLSRAITGKGPAGRQAAKKSLRRIQAVFGAESFKELVAELLGESSMTFRSVIESVNDIPKKKPAPSRGGFRQRFKLAKQKKQDTGFTFGGGVDCANSSFVVT